MTIDRRAMTIRATTEGEDWYRIEWLEHDGRYWEEREKSPRGYWVTYCCLSARLHSRTCVEGSAYEMRLLANAILADSGEHFNRCAVEMRGDVAAFWSPRNSNDVEAIVNAEDARDLARRILATLE